ncbi:MAG: hypothetical protein IT305_08305 [Chloroflexi bacterium]|nr:hypothetical protein [Chloroflexota bacterium]
MHVVINEKLIKTRVRLASAAHVAALVVFAVGLFISWNNPIPSFEEMAGAYGAIIAGLLLYNLGQIFLRRFGPRFRQDSVLTKALKSLDRRYTLLAFPSTRLPDYLLIGPSGIQVIVTRGQGGAVACRANRWSRETSSGLKRVFSLFGGAAFGDPGRDATRGVEQVRGWLEQRGIAASDQPPVEGVIVFTHPSAKLRIDGCYYPVTTLKGFRSTIRGGKAQRDRALSDAGAARVVQALTG